jgi:2-polyprenyl-3-methyl-5-hydroxy-6-metoxy-1,4-benzoquinol methylase
MTSMTSVTTPSPDLFFETLWAYQRTAAIKTAVELDVFSAIHAGAQTADAIARQCAASVRGTRILCDYLAMVGFLVKTEGRYALTLDSATFLVKASPAYMGSVLEFLMTDAIRRNFDRLTDTVRLGTVRPESNIVSKENPVWEDFARAMVPMMGPAAQEMAALLATDGHGRQRVLDIAAGHGLFGIAIAQRNPQAEVVAVDWPRVLTVASENASRLGVAARHRTIAGDAFATDWGRGYDLALVTNFLHHFDIPTCTSFLKKLGASLDDGGRVAVLEFVPDEDRLGPPFPAGFALTMLAETAAGDAYTFAELRGMLEDAGFRDIARHDLHGPETLIVGTR